MCNQRYKNSLTKLDKTRLKTCFIRKYSVYKCFKPYSGTLKKTAGYSINWLLNKRCKKNEEEEDEDEELKDIEVEDSDKLNQAHYPLEKTKCGEKSEDLFEEVHKKQSLPMIAENKATNSVGKADDTNGETHTDFQTDKEEDKEEAGREAGGEEEGQKWNELSEQELLERMKQRVRGQGNNKCIYPFDILFSNVEVCWCWCYEIKYSLDQLIMV